MKRRRLEHPANVDHQDLVRGRADGAAAMPPRAVPRCLPPRIYTRPRSRPHVADALHPIRPTGGDRLGATHRVDLRRAKGRPASSWSTFAYSNSFSISSSPILACSRRWSSSTASVQAGLARRQKLVAPLRGPRRRDTQLPRHTTRGSSPRSRRSTVTRLRRAGVVRSPSGLPPPPGFLIDEIRAD